MQCGEIQSEPLVFLFLLAEVNRFVGNELTPQPMISDGRTKARIHRWYNGRRDRRRDKGYPINGRTDGWTKVRMSERKDGQSHKKSENRRLPTFGQIDEGSNG